MNDGYLMRFEDGPMSHRGNISTAQSLVEGAPAAYGNTIIASLVFSWPLPERLGVLCHEGVEEVAFWNADDPAEGGLPRTITGSPNAVVYAKVTQSALRDDSTAGVLRGAIYRLEEK